jgi:uncharacterized membrane protein
MAGWTRWGLVISCLVGLGYSLYVYQSSPAEVPVHYGTLGLPDRWGHPGEVLAVQLGIMGLSTALFLAVPLALRLPSSWINLPNEAHWLSPEHRADASAKLTLWANATGMSVNLLMIALELLSAPHRVAPPGLPGAAPSSVSSLLVMGFVVFTLFTSIWLALALSAPQRAE